MAYSNWTLSGPATEVFDNTIARSNPDPGWADPLGHLPTGSFGNYARKFPISSGTGYIGNLNLPAFQTVAPGKTQTIQAAFASGPNTIDGAQLYIIRARESVGVYGYNIGMVAIGNPFPFPGSYPSCQWCVILNNGYVYTISISGAPWPNPGPYLAQGNWIGLKLEIRSINANLDELEAFVERSGPLTSDPVQVGSGIWVSTALTPVGYLSPVNTGVVMTGNVLSIPDTSPCFAPHVPLSNTAWYMAGWADFYLDGFKTEIINT